MHLDTRSAGQSTILPGWGLVCPRCGFRADPGVCSEGCPRCLANGQIEALLVEYDALVAIEPNIDDQGIWRSSAPLPRLVPRFRRSLGEGRTPLIRVAELCELTGCDQFWLKMENQNPTAAHKDRFHAVTVAVAAALGCEGVVSWSTGNHGLAMSCYAAAHGLRAVVAGSPRMPQLIQQAIRFAGGLPGLAGDHVIDETLTRLVGEGWFACSTTWPMPLANPYGIEGYKTIGYEIEQDLGELPDATFVPTAGGDVLSGIWRGYRELADSGKPGDPQMLAVQPSGAAPLTHALENDLDEVAMLPEAYSRALSIGDPITGTIGLRTVRESGGTAIAIADEKILETGRLLARHGLIVEPSSAASVAGAIELLDRVPARRKQTNVCIVTSSGLKWLDDYSETALPGAVPVTAADDAIRTVHHHFGA